MSGSTEVGFAAVLAAARRGDAAAWSHLYHEVAPILIGYLRAQRLPDPEDVAGDVLLEVVRDLDRFQGDERSFRSWVLAIAHHRLLDARRRAARRPATASDDRQLARHRASDDTEATCLASVALGELGPALDRLTPDQRTVLLLRIVGDLSVADVATILDKRPGAVKQLQRRAVDALRAVVAPDDARSSHLRAHAPDAAPGDRVVAVPVDAHGSGRTVPR